MTGHAGRARELRSARKASSSSANSQGRMVSRTAQHRPSSVRDGSQLKGGDTCVLQQLRGAGRHDVALLSQVLGTDRCRESPGASIHAAIDRISKSMGCCRRVSLLGLCRTYRRRPFPRVLQGRNRPQPVGVHGLVQRPRDRRLVAGRPHAADATRAVVRGRSGVWPYRHLVVGVLRGVRSNLSRYGPDRPRHGARRSRHRAGAHWLRRHPCSCDPRTTRWPASRSSRRRVGDDRRCCGARICCWRRLSLGRYSHSRHGSELEVRGDGHLRCLHTLLHDWATARLVASPTDAARLACRACAPSSWPI